MEQVRLCTVCPKENWRTTYRVGWMIWFWICYSRALERWLLVNIIRCWRHLCHRSRGLCWLHARRKAGHTLIWGQLIFWAIYFSFSSLVFPWFVYFSSEQITPKKVYINFQCDIDQTIILEKAQMLQRFTIHCISVVFEATWLNCCVFSACVIRTKRTLFSKVCIKSPRTVVWFLQIVYCLSDNSSRGQAIPRHR